MASLIVTFWVIGFKTFNASTYFFPDTLIVYKCLSNVSPCGEYVNVACSIILLWSNGNIYSPVRYSYLSILPDDNADIFSASLLI